VERLTHGEGGVETYTVFFKHLLLATGDAIPSTTTTFLEADVVPHGVNF